MKVLTFFEFQVLTYKEKLNYLYKLVQSGIIDFIKYELDSYSDSGLMFFYLSFLQKPIEQDYILYLMLDKFSGWEH